MVSPIVLTITWLDLLFAVVLATVIYLLEIVFLPRLMRNKKASHDQAYLSEIGALKNEIKDIQRRLENLESCHVPSEGVQDELDLSTYGAAKQYARLGMPVEEIAARCGISRDEATLIMTMYRSTHT